MKAHEANQLKLNNHVFIKTLSKEGVFLMQKERITSTSCGEYHILIDKSIKNGSDFHALLNQIKTNAFCNLARKKSIMSC